MTLRFFHFSGAQAAQFQVGRRLRCYGEAKPGALGLEMVHPSYRFIAESETAELRESLDPVYPAIEGIGPQSLARIIAEALARLPDDDSLELLPVALLESLRLPTLRMDAARVLAALRERCWHAGPKVVYGEACRLGDARLAAEENILRHGHPLDEREFLINHRNPRALRIRELK